MTGIRSIFIDSGAYIALADRSDQNHGRAVACLRELGSGATRMTSWGVVSETYTWLRYHGSASSAAGWLVDLERACHLGQSEVVLPDAQIDGACRRKLLRFADQNLSYVDGMTLAILESLPGIDAVFGFDHHLGLTGLPVLPRS